MSLRPPMCPPRRGDRVSGTDRVRAERARAAFVLFFVLLCPGASAEERLFEGDDILPVVFRGPFDLIDRERDKDKEYEGSLSYTDPQRGPTTLRAKFSVRGNFRLRRDICSHAQLWVNLKKGELPGTLFAGQNKLKLVIQCRDASRYAEYLARERQAYLIFEELSDLSLATRPLRARFIDREGGDEREQAAFFIQHHKRLAASRNLDLYDEPSADRTRLDPAQSATVALFMYLVSNTDYSFIAAAPGEGCCHNIKLLEAEDGRLYPLPYDYDSTGFVNASYAEPAAGIGQNRVTQRIYRGYCAPEEVTMDAVALLQQKRDVIYRIIADEDATSPRGVKRARRFIDKFYDVLEKPRKLRREILEACR